MDRFGAFIEYGVQDWQIFQRINGYAEITIGGRWVSLYENRDPAVYVRVLNEYNGHTVTDWFTADITPENKWSATFSLPEGGLYMIETALLETSEKLTRIDALERGDIAHHIGVGDLFMIAGQSNASGFGHGEAYDPPVLGVHITDASGKWKLAVNPLNDSTDAIYPAIEEPQVGGNSPFLSFARELTAFTGCPVGLVQTSRAGWKISHWAQDGTGEVYERMRDAISELNGLTAVLWYQGCSDALYDEAEQYYERFESLVNAIRKHCGWQLPFFTAQLNRHLDTEGGHMDETWGTVREAQRCAAHCIPDVYIMPTEDLALSDGIHNSASANVLLGRRFASQVKHVLYGQKPFKAPEVTRITLSEAALILACPEAESLKIDNGSRPFFAANDELGAVPTGEPVCREQEIILPLLRPVTGDVYVSGGAEANPSNVPPKDTLTNLPLIAFYRIKAER